MLGSVLGCFYVFLLNLIFYEVGIIIIRGKEIEVS